MEIDPLDHYTNVGRRIVELREMLQSRQGNPAYEKNCTDIEHEIARLETVQRAHAPVPQDSEQ